MKMLHVVFLSGLICALGSSLKANISIEGIGGIITAFTITEDIEITITETRLERDFLLVFNDVYTSNTFLNTEDEFTQTPIGNPVALLNDAISTNFTSTWLIPEDLWDLTGQNSSRYEPTDMSILYQFSGYTQLNAGDTLLLKKGTILPHEGLDIPMPDNLGSSVTAHLVYGDSGAVASEDFVLSIVPEVAHFSLLAGLVCVLVLLRRGVSHSK